MESEEDEVEAEESGTSEDPDVMRKLESALNELQVVNLTGYSVTFKNKTILQICGELLGKHWKNLAKPLSEIESTPDPDLLNSKVKEVCERATLFRISSNAMINVGFSIQLSIS